MLEEPPILTIKAVTRRPTDAQAAAFQGVPTGFVVDAMKGGGALERTIRHIGRASGLPLSVAGPALTVDCGPGDVLAALASPVPTYTMLEFEGATAISPMDATPVSSNTGSKEMPVLVVFQTPPEAAAM